MQHAVYLPPFGEFAEPARLAEVAITAEESGWDGLFLWDHVWRPPGKPAEVADAWIMLTLAAANTSRIRLGPMVVPLARRRPQKVARESVTLDRLSNGRLILGIGLGVDTGGELGRFGETTDDRTRAERLDEALALVQALWSGEVVEHRGRHFRADGVRFLPRPLQQPRIPVWAAARGGGPARPLRRAAALDGLFPVDTSIEQLDAMLEVVATSRGGSLEGFDVAVLATPRTDFGALAARHVSWAMWSFEEGESAAEVLAVVRRGPVHAAGQARRRRPR